MNHSRRNTSGRMYALRIGLVLLTLTLLVLVSGCALRNHNGANGQPGQQTTGQQTGGQNSTGQTGGSNSAAQQIQNSDQQIQDAMQGIDGAQNDANNANNQSSQENNTVP